MKPSTFRFDGLQDPKVTTSRHPFMLSLKVEEIARNSRACTVHTLLATLAPAPEHDRSFHDISTVILFSDHENCITLRAF